MYGWLHTNIAAIYADARAADEIGIPDDLRGKIRLTGSISSGHALLRSDVSQAMDAAARQVIENQYLAEELRRSVKHGCGDKFGASAMNTCEGAFWVTFDTLVTPPLAGRGENDRSWSGRESRHVRERAQLDGSGRMERRRDAS